MKESFKIAVFLVIVQLFCPVNNIIAQDTLVVKTDTVPSSREHRRQSFTPDPLKATMLGVAFPGLGQIYNRKLWKVPVVYAGFGVLVYFISYNSSNYNEFMTAYQDFTDEVPETDSYLSLIKNIDPSEYDPVLYPDSYVTSYATWAENGLLDKVDYFKKYRDLSYIGLAAWYLVSVLEANVDASLHNYNINDNLNIDIAPTQLPLGAGFNIRMVITF